MKAKIAGTDAHKLKRRKYESELRKLQIRLCHLQDWVVSRGLRVIIIFEGRNDPGDYRKSQSKGVSCRGASGAQ
jgi:polyphosphate kinase 2 (PPK2 family)